MTTIGNHWVFVVYPKYVKFQTSGKYNVNGSNPIIKGENYHTTIGRILESPQVFDSYTKEIIYA